jgi:hypothetical protein
VLSKHKRVRSWSAFWGRTQPARRAGFRPQLVRLEDRLAPAVTITATNNGGSGYTGLDKLFSLVEA